MSTLKRYTQTSVYDAAVDRITKAFDAFEKVYVSFSGGKDSTTMLHLVMAEAERRNRTVGILVIDLEAQYTKTIQHISDTLDRYAKLADVHWVCLPMLLRNAVSNFQPRWCCWEPSAKELWVREMPTHKDVVSDPKHYPFFEEKMEFEEFMVLWGVWYADGAKCCGFIGIRADESLNRFRTIASKTKETLNEWQWTTRVEENLYNAYPVYDWKTADIWRYHARYPENANNPIYDQMHKAGVPLSQMRLCQPYGDDQRRGLWLYHILEPQTWFKVVARVNGANSGALYVEESGNITGYNKISKPPGHTWESFCKLLLQTLPSASKDHYIKKFRSFIKGWKGRGYNQIPDEAPPSLENKHWAPSWRRMCKVLLRNDYWCKGLGYTQPKSDAYGRYIEIRKKRKLQIIIEENK